ncbi:hypothetical protein GDO81_012382 [Engystomops pustulosus]|uniref:Uncharacterized protein n=1 Tax=Engystomops pustulosus TaxID=76066 RepID=A0AAV7BL77_ENGPU|nr:hypothetical protein GDO81_012382 [Engystomops pustulosus]
MYVTIQDDLPIRSSVSDYVLQPNPAFIFKIWFRDPVHVLPLFCFLDFHSLLSVLFLSPLCQNIFSDTSFVTCKILDDIITVGLLFF